jgi:hypothetical protein
VQGRGELEAEGRTGRAVTVLRKTMNSRNNAETGEADSSTESEVERQSIE